MKNIAIKFSNVSLSFGPKLVWDNLSIELEQGKTYAIMGPSGRGKTTFLRMIASLQTPTKGTIECRAERIAFLFQNPMLFPWSTALENVNTVLGDKKETIPFATEWLERVELASSAHLYPSELSGGMCQRVALARTLAFGGDIYLFDEPFRGLDEACRERMISLVRRCTANATVVFVTHDEKDVKGMQAEVLRI